MVTMNILTDLDVANGSRGEIVDIILDEREEIADTSASIIKLRYPPCGAGCTHCADFQEFYDPNRWTAAEDNKISVANDISIQFY